jgi:catechol 2,3-dioxygenase-like lactoylglutathione lyase family enzyme
MIIDLNHVNIVTEKVDETRAFFERVLGLTSGYRPDFDFDGAWLYAGDKPVIHLQALASSKNRPAGEPIGLGALDHASFEVASIAEARERLTANAVKFREVRSPDGRNDQIFFREPNGAVIELIARVA